MAPQIQTQEHASVIAAQNGEGAASGGRYSRIIQDINAAGVSRDLARISEAVAGVRSTLGALGAVGDEELTRISRKALDLQTALGGDMTEHIQMAAIMMKTGSPAAVMRHSTLSRRHAARFHADARRDAGNPSRVFYPLPQYGFHRRGNHVAAGQYGAAG
jgi:hypothetical protein